MTNVPAKFNAFSVGLANTEDGETIAFGSTAEPPTGHHTIFVSVPSARQLILHLQAMIDHLDPPKQEWRAVEHNDPNVLVDHIRKAVRAHVKRKIRRKTIAPKHKPRKVK